MKVENMDECPNCKAVDKEILLNGKRCRCRNCGEIFTLEEEIEYDEKFNKWYSENRVELYDTAVRSLAEIVNIIDKKDWPAELKIAALSIVVNNIKLHHEINLNIKELKREMDNKIMYS